MVQFSKQLNRFFTLNGILNQNRIKCIQILVSIEKVRYELGRYKSIHNYLNDLSAIGNHIIPLKTRRLKR